VIWFGFGVEGRQDTNSNLVGCHQGREKLRLYCFLMANVHLSIDPG
jgi:hypothetical protein